MMTARRPPIWRYWPMFAVLVGLSGLAKAQTAIPPSAADFAMMAAQSDQYEIMAGRDAITQSQNPQIKNFAQQMIQDHGRMGGSLSQAVMASAMEPPPPSMSGDQAAMLAALQSLRGADFDRAYARQQVLAHQQALAVEQSYVAAGASPTLRKVAQSGVSVIQRHLKLAEQIRAALGGS